MSQQSKSIAIFDSGVGGLTVLRAIRALLPHENFLYLGDTARVPYGSKSPQSVERYAHQAVSHLIAHDIKCIVIACNTASAFGLEHLKTQFPHTPILGVIEPGARALAETGVKHAAVLATQGTIDSGAYHDAIRSLAPEIKLLSVPCPLLVPMAEESWHEGPLVEQILTRILQPILSIPLSLRPEACVLGCTHFPVFAKAIAHVLSEDNPPLLIDSADTTAKDLQQLLINKKLLNTSSILGKTHYLVTDSVTRFLQSCDALVHETVSKNTVQHVDLI